MFAVHYEDIQMVNQESPRDKLRILLRLCGGYRKYDGRQRRYWFIKDSDARNRLVQNLWSKNEDYALTFDNILKIVAIYFRVKAQLPVLIMGETGCGKTRLLKYMADILSMHMITVDVHSGFTMKELEQEMNKAVRVAQLEYQGITVLLFFDKINTSKEMSSFKEIICDHSFRGQTLPSNLIIIGALNPYRNYRSRRQSEWKPAMQRKNYNRKQRQKQGSKLIYNVYPLQQSMKRFVWNFGYMLPSNEREYIAVIVNREWKQLLKSLPIANRSTSEKYLNQYKSVFAGFIDISLERLRHWLNDVSVCSLRDVRRANTFFAWFYGQFRDLAPMHRTTRSLVMALAVCFYYRLGIEHRRDYENLISMYFNKLPKDLTPQANFTTKTFRNKLKLTEEWYLDILDIPDGIALTRSLKESLFVILVSILTKTPIILIGPPGSSKTLAVRILERNLHPFSKNKKLDKLGISNHFFHSLQCTKLTTFEMIAKEWGNATRTQNSEESPQSVLFLDEIGLAGHSERRPLTVLHNLLENPTMAFIGTSRGPLDSAKMNRAILHEGIPIDYDRPELTLTAKALAEKGPGGPSVYALNSKLDKLVDFYRKLVRKQKTPESPFRGVFHFYGARDFYNLIAYLKFSCNALKRTGDEKLLMEAICRNFGGLNEDLFDKYMAELILETVDFSDFQSTYDEMTAINLIRSNISQTASEQKNPQTQNYEMRHVMLITDTEVSWKYLYDLDVLNQNTSRVIFGSKFKNDRNSSLHFHQQLESIKNAMVSGHTVVLLHLNELYESLYDVLNQRYLKVGTKRFCKIFIRDRSETVQIHPSFRFVIVVPTARAYHLSRNPNDHTPVAFLNRLEKQHFSFINLKGDRENWEETHHALWCRVQDLFGEEVDYTQIFAGFIPRFTFASVLIYAENILFGRKGANQPQDQEEGKYDEQGPRLLVDNDSKKEPRSQPQTADEDNRLVQFAVALLLTNCYQRYFIGHANLDLHRSLMPLRRDKSFSSVKDVMEYYDDPKNDGVFVSNIDPLLDNIKLIRITTHDHFQYLSDFAKYFRIKHPLDEMNLAKKSTIIKIQQNDSKTMEEGDTLNQNKDGNDNAEKREVVIVNVADVVSSNAFVGVVNDFLMSPDIHTLIVQTTNLNNDEFLHNLHIQYLIEQSKNASMADTFRRMTRCKQIVVVIYMKRLPEGSIDTDVNPETAQFIQSQQYPLIFNRGWRQVYCDAVLPSDIRITDLNVNDPDSTDLLDARIREHVGPLIQSALPMALKHIRFPIRMRHEVDRVVKLLENDKAFQRAVFAQIRGALLLNDRGDAPLNAIKDLLQKLSFGENEASTDRTEQHRKRKQVPKSDIVISERGSFRQLVIKQISEQLKSELGEVLIAILSNHTSTLYQDLPLKSDPHLRDGAVSGKDAIRRKLAMDVDMHRIWLMLLGHRSGIVRVKQKLGRSNKDGRIVVEDKLRVMFPFSPYIYLYFQNAQRKMVDEVQRESDFKRKDIKVAESGREGQQVMGKVISRHLKFFGQDDCLLAIDKYIEWYVYDVAELDLQNKFGKRHDTKYSSALIRFIQQFILCAVHGTHHLFEADEKSTAVAAAAQSIVYNAITDDPESEPDDFEEEAFFEEEESEEEVGDEIAAAETDDDECGDPDDHYNDDCDEDQNDDGDEYDEQREVVELKENEDKPTPENDVVDCDEEKAPTQKNQYPYGIHEVYASLWCNEALLQHLIAILKMFESEPQGLEEIVTICWEDTTRDFRKCIFDFLEQIVDRMQDGFRRKEWFLYKCYIGQVVVAAPSISWILKRLGTDEYDTETIDAKWELTRLYLLCYKPFEKYTDRRQIKQIMDGLQRLLDEFQGNQHHQNVQFDDVNKVQFLHELLIDIGRNITSRNQEEQSPLTREIVTAEQDANAQNVIQQYICNFAFRTFEQNGIIPGEAFIKYCISLMSEVPPKEEDLRVSGNKSKQYPSFYPTNYTKQRVAAKILKLISAKEEMQEMSSVLQQLNDELDRSPGLCSLFVRAAESEHHLKWLRKRRRHQTPTIQQINRAVRSLIEVEQRTLLQKLLVVAECKVILYYAVSKMTMKTLSESFDVISKMYFIKFSSDDKFRALINGLGFYFFAEIWRQRSGVEACRLRRMQKFAKRDFLQHIFRPDDMQEEGGDVIILKSKYRRMNDNIFNLLVKDGYERKPASKWQSTAVVKDGDKLVVTEKESRFDIISKALHQAMRKQSKIDPDLLLRPREVVHLVGALFNCAYLYGGADEPKQREVLVEWLKKQSDNFMDKTSREWTLMLQLMKNRSNDATLKFNVSKPPKCYDMMRIRLMWHLFGVSCSVGIAQNPFHTSFTIRTNPFYILLTNPLYFQKRPLIGMPESSTERERTVGYSNDWDGEEVRGLIEIEVCIIRCFILCCLLLHHSEKSAFSSDAMKFMYPQRVTGNGQGQRTILIKTQEDLSVDINNQIKKYIQKIQEILDRSTEDTFYVLHAIIHKMYNHHDAKLPIFYDLERNQCPRKEFERFFKTHCMDAILHDLDGSINRVRSIAASDTFRKYWSKRMGMTFDVENEEDMKLKRAFEAKYAPHLFLPFRRMTVHNFKMFAKKNSPQNQHPVTCGIVDALNEVGSLSFATRYIPSIINWMKKVHQRLSGRISKKELEQKDPKTKEWKYSAKWLLDTLEKEGTGDRKELEKELRGFVNGWNDVAKRVTTNESEADGMIVSVSDLPDLEPNKGAKTVPIPIITPRDPKVGIQPVEVPLKLCIFAGGNEVDSSVMIRDILDHLVAANKRIRHCCKASATSEDEELFFMMKEDVIALSDVARESDVVDLTESELLTILQECSQQSLEYGVSSSFEMNLSLLEMRLYERYIIGRKMISMGTDAMEFEFAEHHDIQSNMDRTNHTLALKQEQLEEKSFAEDQDRKHFGDVESGAAFASPMIDMKQSSEDGNDDFVRDVFGDSLNHLKLFFNHFCPKDKGKWVKRMVLLEQKIQNVDDVNLHMEKESALQLEHNRQFLKELAKYSRSGIFKDFWAETCVLYASKWSSYGGIKHQDVDVVDMCFWLETVDWTPDQWPILVKLRDFFGNWQITGSELNEAIQAGDNAEELFYTLLTSVGNFEVDYTECQMIFRVLFAKLKRERTFKLKLWYSLSALQVMYNERIKPKWDSFCDELQRGQCTVYNVQRYFELNSWHIPKNKIADEVARMRIDEEKMNQKVTNDVFDCFQCIQSVSICRIIADAMVLLQSLLRGSVRFTELKMDPKYQEFKKTLDLVHEFDFCHRHSNDDDFELGIAEFLSLSSNISMKMDHLLQFWRNHQNAIGKVRCDHEGLKWLFTLSSHDVVLGELFSFLENDAKCMFLRCCLFITSST